MAKTRNTKPGKVEQRLLAFEETPGKIYTQLEISKICGCNAQYIQVIEKEAIEKCKLNLDRLHLSGDLILTLWR